MDEAPWGAPPPPRPRPDLGGSRGLLARAAANAAGSPDAAEAAPPPPRDPALPLPLPWSNYFDAEQDVHCPERGATFHVCTAGSSGPVVLCLHGGGYTGLSWALIARRLKDKCRVIAPDLRAHGRTQAQEASDFSAATLAADVVALWQRMFGSQAGSGAADVSSSAAQAEQPGQLPQQQPLQPQQEQPGGAHPPPTVLVGHSMGGAIAVHAAALGGISSLAGVVVIDVVEGTAIASLPYMNTVLQKRPKRFASLQDAVDWALDTGMCKRQEAAHVSLPSMLRQLGAGEDAAAAAAGPAQPLTAGGLEPLVEEEGEEEADPVAQDVGQPPQLPARPQVPPRPPQAEAESAAPTRGLARGDSGSSGGGGGSGSSPGWVWRTQLEQSAPFWEGWYSGLSDMFLSLRVPKVLVLVGTDRLDRPLTIGQMQGKFQPVLLPQAGHAVHEDEPDRTADAIATFIRRFRIGEPPLQIPRPAAGVPRILPVPIGPAFAPPGQQHAQQ
ncbi:phosphatase methylesterase 1 [Chlorella sorokiniana]|uniref:protein phosphatase methylesterase-1 n=1 Tax=Chlorella sorokiniana TaxID=3076 RepID=A0A2P6U3R7_CHLSO|nr:phosphatase methylesterase 1 [Chlorella sorokiniana]|eukprot:PRW60955.1 phosphatase methylesterase 1 [Chlorella sorokiniana]